MTDWISQLPEPKFTRSLYKIFSVWKQNIFQCLWLTCCLKLFHNFINFPKWWALFLISLNQKSSNVYCSDWWMSYQGIKKGKYHCTIDLLFDWFGLICFANKNINCQLSYNWFQTSQTGGQWYSDTSPFSISWSYVTSDNKFNS